MCGQDELERQAGPKQYMNSQPTLRTESHNPSVTGSQLNLSKGVDGSHLHFVTGNSGPIIKKIDSGDVKKDAGMLSHV